MPAVRDLVRLEGQAQEVNGKLMFVADKLEKVTRPGPHLGKNYGASCCLWEFFWEWRQRILSGPACSRKWTRLTNRRCWPW